MSVTPPAAGRVGRGEGGSFSGRMGALIIVPGAGALTAALRATMWGVLLAPTLVSLSAGMLPHAFTLLVEGEAYVLAAFFGLLIPIYLFQSAGQQTLGERYRRALVLNLQGCVLVALVLLVAAWLLGYL